VYYPLSEQVQVDYLLNLQIEDATYQDLRRIEMSFVKLSGIIQKVFPNSDAAKIMRDANRIINAMHSVQIAVRDAERAYTMYKLARMGEAAFDPILAISTGISIVSSGLSVYESTVGTY
jgi:hypothetical protein